MSDSVSQLSKLLKYLEVTTVYFYFTDALQSLDNLLERDALKVARLETGLVGLVDVAEDKTPIVQLQACFQEKLDAVVKSRKGVLEHPNAVRFRLFASQQKVVEGILYQAVLDGFFHGDSPVNVLDPATIVYYS